MPYLIWLILKGTFRKRLFRIRERNWSVALWVNLRRGEEPITDWEGIAAGELIVPRSRAESSRRWSTDVYRVRRWSKAIPVILSVSVNSTSAIWCFLKRNRMCIMWASISAMTPLFMHPVRKAWRCHICQINTGNSIIWPPVGLVRSGWTGPWDQKLREKAQ